MPLTNPAIVSISAGAGIATGPEVILSNLNGVSFGANGNTITASVATVSVPVVSNAIQDVATATRSGTNTSRFAADDHAHRGVVAVDVNGIASSFYGQVDLSAGNLIALSTAGASTAGSIAFHNLLSSSAIAQPVSSVSAAGTLSSRFALADHAHPGIMSVSVLGNTAGNTSAGAGSFVLAGGPNITLSGSTAAGGLTLSVSAAATTLVPVVSNAIQDVATATRSGTNTSRFAADDHAHRGVVAVDVNGIASSFYGQVDLSAGNLMALSTAGASTAGSIAFHNLLSSSNIAQPVSSVSAAGTLSSRFALADHAHPGIMSVSVLGNTAGNTSAGAGSFVLAGGPNITLSGSTAAGGLTLSVSAAATTLVPVVSNAIQDVATATRSGTNTSRFAADDHAHRGVVAVDVNGIASSFYGQVDLSAGNLMALSTAGASTAGSIAFHNLLSSSNIAQPVSSVSAAGTLSSRFALADHAHPGIMSVSVLGNTAGNTSAGAGSFVLAGGPNITLSGSTAAGGLTLSVSAAATTLVPVVSNAIQDVATATRSGTNTSRFAADDHAHRGVVAVDVNGIASSFYGQVDLSAGNLMALSTAGASTAGSIAFHNLLSSSAIAQPVSSVSAAGTLSSRFALADHAHPGIMSVSVLGNTAGNTSAGAGSFVLAGGPNITLSGSTAAGGLTLSVSAAATTLVPVVSNAIQDVATATRSGTNTSRFAADDHAHRGVVAVDVNGIASSFYGQVDLSAGNLMALSTAGASTAGSIAFHNLLSSSAIAQPVSSVSAAGTLSSRFALADHAHPGIMSVSVLGNTAGNTSAGAGSFVLAGGPNITLSGSTAAGGITLSISGATVGAVTAGISGIAANGSTATSGNVLFNNLNGISFGYQTGASTTNITASMDAVRSISAGTSSGSFTGLTFSNSNNVSFGLNAGTLTASASVPSRQVYDNLFPNASGTVIGTTNNSLLVFPLGEKAGIWNGNMTVLTVNHDFSFGSNATMTAARTVSVYFAIYTVSASSTLNMLYSASTALTNNATSNASASWHGQRWVTMDATLFQNASITLSEGSEYYCAMLVRSAAGGTTMSMSHVGGAFLGTDGTAPRFGTAGVSQAVSLASAKFTPFYGILGTTTTAIPASIHITDITNPANGIEIPHIIFENRVSKF